MLTNVYSVKKFNLSARPNQFLPILSLHFLIVAQIVILIDCAQTSKPDKNFTSWNTYNSSQIERDERQAKRSEVNSITNNATNMLDPFGNTVCGRIDTSTAPWEQRGS